VARALWDSHWREEACIVHESCIDFYSPLTSKACFSIPFYDIQCVRRVEERSGVNPLSGFPLVAVETAWKCHYLAFSNEEIQTNFFDILNAAIFSNVQDLHKEEEWKAHMWQEVQSSADSSGETSKWANIVSSKKFRQRIILNSRRMPFDCKSFEYDQTNTKGSDDVLCSFVEGLLRKALSFSLKPLDNPSDFIKFLDDTSRLRELSLSEVDKDGRGTFCMCVNLYHCLLQHALLLSKTGPPTKRNVGHFMRTHCYEIGGDVFSLAELESCVIRGNMSQAYYPKPPYVRAPKKSRGHLAYSLDFVDPRIMFVLNTGNLSHPPEVPVLKPDSLEEQLSVITRLYLNKHVKIDQSRRTVTLPKVCDV